MLSYNLTENTRSASKVHMLVHVLFDVINLLYPASPPFSSATGLETV